MSNKKNQEFNKTNRVLALSFLTLSFLLLLILFFFGIQYLKISNSFSQSDLHTQKMSLAQEMVNSSSNRGTILMTLLYEKDVFIIEDKIDELQYFAEQYIYSKERLLELGLNAEESKFFNLANEMANKSSKSIYEAINYMRNEELELAYETILNGIEFRKLLVKSMNDFLSVVGSNVSKNKETLESELMYISVFFVFFAIAAFLLSIIIGIFVYRKIYFYVEEKEILLKDLSILYDQAEYNANHDVLTSLQNRKAFESELDKRLFQAIRYEEFFTVVYIDLDGFKAVNDKYGHAAGDEVLCHVSSIFKKEVRNSDYVFRIGGDEFAMLLPNTSLKDAESYAASRFLNALREPFVIAGDKEVVIGASIGLSSYPEHGDNIKDLLNAADQAMYYSKNTGKNKISIAEIESKKIKLYPPTY